MRGRMNAREINKLTVAHIIKSNVVGRFGKDIKAALHNRAYNNQTKITELYNTKIR